MRGITVTSGWTALLPGFIVAGAGVGLVNPALASTAIGVVPPQRSGMASGINNTFRQVGIATGIAVLGAIFESSLTTTITPKLAGTAAAGQGAEIARAVAAGGAQKVVAGIPAAERADREHGDSRGVRQLDERHPARRGDRRVYRGRSSGWYWCAAATS